MTGDGYHAHDGYAHGEGLRRRLPRVIHPEDALAAVRPLQVSARLYVPEVDKPVVHPARQLLTRVLRGERQD